MLTYLFLSKLIVYGMKSGSHFNCPCNICLIYHLFLIDLTCYTSFKNPMCRLLVRSSLSFIGIYLFMHKYHTISSCSAKDTSQSPPCSSTELVWYPRQYGTVTEATLEINWGRMLALLLPPVDLRI